MAYTHYRASGGGVTKGTSGAAPLVAGAIAMFRTTRGPDAVPPSALYDVLRQSARRAGSVGYDTEFGHGIIDIEAAISQFH
jgi:subtilase family serine protease